MSSLNDLKSCELYVEGMHCAACEILIEDKVNENKNIINAKASLSQHLVEINLAQNTTIDEVLPQLNAELSKHGYKLHKEKPREYKIDVFQNLKAFAIAALLMTTFLLSQKLGLSSFLSSEKITYPYIFLIGLVASLSTCMAVVGGVVLTLSANYLKSQKSATVPLVNFHFARLLGFFVLGGIIGLLGTIFTITPLVTFVINFLLFIVMVILGVNMLELFPSISRMQLRIPSAVGKFILKTQNSKSKLTPYALGVLSFFLPCGFTQSMQFYAITTGNFVSGALTMLVFALGTLPVLAGISFLSEKFSRGLSSKLFYFTAGYLIIFFAVLNFYGALVAVGWIPPLLTF